MAYLPLINVVPQFFDNLGDPLVGGTLNAYLAGTSTPSNMFSDNVGTVAGTSVTLDSRGEPTTIKMIWVDTDISYKFILKDSSGTTIWTEDNIQVTSIQDGSVTADKLASNAVTSAKIATGAVTTGKIADSNITSAKIADNAVTVAKLQNNGYELGFRNKIINGEMQIYQRGSSFTATGYTLDRWLYTETSGATCSVTTNNESVNNGEFYFTMWISPSVADTSISSTEICTIEQRIEGYNARDLISEDFTLSFWVSSSKTGTHCVAFQNNGNDRSYVMEYTINAANTYEYKTITVTGGLITTGSWQWTNACGVAVVFVLAAGSSFQTTTGEWKTGDYVATSNQVNLLDSTSNIFKLTGVQLEKGSTATPFEHIPYADTLSRCQRYYETGTTLTFRLFTSLTASAQSRGFAATKAYSPTMTITPSSGTGATVGADPNGFSQTNAHSAMVGADWTASSEM